MQTLWQDIKFGARMLRRNPGFTAVAVLTLALGIGANTAIFSVMNGVLLRPLPYPDSDNLMMVWETNLEKGWTQENLTLPNFADWRLGNRVFESMAAFTNFTVTLIGGDRPERINSAVVTHGFFSTLGVNPTLGRKFLPKEDRPGSGTVAILSYGLWQRHTAGDSTIIGKKLILNNNPYTVVGVMPGGFEFPGGTELWTPLARDPATAPRRRNYLRVVARLKPGVTRSQAKSDMDNLTAQLAKDYPNANGGWGASIVPLLEQTVGNARTPLLVLMGAVGFVLLIACANVANLLLARSSGRERELAVRRALGAGRVRLVRQLLTESLLLALLGGAAGVATALGGLRWLLVVRPANLPRIDTVTLDYFALGFTLSITLLMGILFGLLPALQASRGDLALSLKEGGRSSDTSSGNRVRGTLVVAEVALAVILLVGAGLLIRSFGELIQVDPGFKTDGILTFRISLPSARYSDEATAASFYQNFLNEVRTLPGVERASAISHVPVGDGNSSLAIAEGDDPFLHPDGSFISALHRQVDPDYHRIMGILPVRGRLLSPSDTAESFPVVLINQTMARRYWPNETNIVGKRVAVPNLEKGEHSWWTVVGVVGYARDIRMIGREVPQTYFPQAQGGGRVMHVAVKTAVEPESILPLLRREVASVDPNVPIYQIRTLDFYLNRRLTQPRFYALLMGLFAGIALVLGVIGLYGVISYTISLRTHEIGIRMALGAQAGDILRMVLRQGLLLTLAGVGIGLAGAYGLTRFLGGLLYGIAPTDLGLYAGVTSLLAVVALLACYVPARRATKVDSMVALRYE